MYFMYIKPTLAEISTLSEKKTEYLNVLLKSKELKARRDVALSAYNNISADDIDKLSKIVPVKFDSVLFANDLNSIASRYGMFIKDLKIDQTKTEGRSLENVQTDGKTYKTITVFFWLSGQYEQFVRFLKDIESSLRLLDVSNLTISANVSAGVKSLIVSIPDYSLEIYTYSLQ